MTNNYYINNSELATELEFFKKTCQYNKKGKYVKGKISEVLGEMILRIATNLGNDRCFVNYTWKSDMVAEAVFTCVKYLHNYDKEKSGNPFGYITMICRHAFLNFIAKQKKHAKIKDVCFNSVDELIEEENESYAQRSINYSILKISKK
jgi:hypothetical protein